MIDLAYLHEQCENLKRKDILKQYHYWHNEKKEVWLWNKPDLLSRDGRSQVKRKKKEDIEQCIIEFHLATHEQGVRCDEMIVEDLLYEFIEWKKGLVSSKSIKLHMDNWKKYYEPQQWFISKPISEVTKLDIDKVHEYILDNYTKRAGKGQGFIKALPTSKAFDNIKGVMKQMFEYATDDADYLEKNPYRVKIHKKKVLPNRKKENEETIFFPDEERALISEMKEQYQQNVADTSTQAIRLCFETGLRIGELLALRESDLLYYNGNPHICVQRQQVEITDVSDVRNTITKVGYEIVEYAKSDCSIRNVPLSDEALQIVDEVKRINKEYHKSFEDYLFLKDGKIMPPTVTDNTINRACRHCQIKVRRLHSIRKTYASKLYANGVDIPTISKMLGHADEETTRRHYIFSLQTKDENYDNVVKALEKSRQSQKATRGNQKIVSLRGKKKVG